MPKEISPVNQLFSSCAHILDGAGIPAKMPAMSDRKTQPQISDKGQSEAELRRQRQAEALRANLARRKTQARGRADDQPPAQGGGHGGSDGTAAD